MFLGHAPKSGVGTLDWGRMRRTARELLDALDSHDLDVDVKVGTLSVANRQRVEIAKALSQNASSSSWTSRPRRSPMPTSGG